MKTLILASLLMILAGYASAKDYTIQHLEPANWWVGMKHSQVELMVHGDEIAQLKPQIKYAGVKILAVKKATNPNYLFITIDINPSAKPGKFDIEFIHDKKAVARFRYKLFAREKNSAERKGFDSSDAIVLITPDRFANGNAANDSVDSLSEQANRSFSGGRHGGDLAGMTQHLDYLASMGFTQIWPNPLVENNQPQYSYHGYAATNLYAIDARFGTNKDFKHFVKKAKSKGIGVIQDIILNHIGSGHWWMSDLPGDDWLNNQHAYVETNHRRTSVQDPYVAPADKAKFTDGWFSQAMPDLNQRNPRLASYLIQNTLWWIEYAGLSGVREDTYGYADEKFLSAWAKAVMEEYPNFNIVGEEWSSNPAIVAHWQKGKQNSSGHISHLPSVMDFPLYEALRSGLEEGESWDKGFIRLYETLANDFIYPDPFNLVIFPENHDTSRIYSYLHEDIDLFKMAMVYTATMRGIPQFYYGSEILLTSPRERDDGAVRTDMPGGWAGDKQNAFTGQGLSKAQLQAQGYIKQLLNWRKLTPVIHSGKLQHFSPVDGIYVYFRYSDEKTVMVILNKSKQQKSLDLARFDDFLRNKKSALNVMTGKRLALTDKLNLGARSSSILEIMSK